MIDTFPRCRRPGTTRNAIAALLAASMVGLCGCTAENAVTAASTVSAIQPVVITVLKNRAVVLPAQVRGVAMVGTYAAGVIADEVVARLDVTYLLINHRVDGIAKTTIFRIDSTRKLKITMNGKFVQEVEQNRIEITPDPEADSRITVMDSNSADPIFREGTYRMNPLYPDRREIDLDSGEYRGSKDDAELRKTVDLEYVLPSLSSESRFPARAVNGAEIASWDFDEVSLAGCSSLPESRWSDITDPFAWNDVFPVLCVRTSEGRFGSISGSLQGVKYIIWEKVAA